MKKRIPEVLAGFLLAAAASQAGADIVLDGGPAWGTGPVDVTYTSSGSTLNGGATYLYTQAAASAGVSAVYFGLWSGGTWGFSGNGSGVTGGEVYHFQGATANTIEYRGSTQVPMATGGAYAVFTRLMLTANSGATVVTDATTLGLASDVHSLFLLTGGTFSVTREVELSLDGTNWSNAQPFYDSLQFKAPGNGFDNQLNTGFYWTNAVVDGSLPEPDSLALAGISLLVLTGVRRARKAG